MKTIKKVNGQRKVITLNDTLYVPDWHTNLVSIRKITDKGHNVLFSKTKAESLEDWHIRMEHLNIQSLCQGIKTGSIQGINFEGIDEDFECSVCLQSKMCRAPFPKASKRITEVGDLIHSDVFGPIRVASHAKRCC